jgi:hypothetical protein
MKKSLYAFLTLMVVLTVGAEHSFAGTPIRSVGDVSCQSYLDSIVPNLVPGKGSFYNMTMIEQWFLGFVTATVSYKIADYNIFDADDLVGKLRFYCRQNRRDRYFFVSDAAAQVVEEGKSILAPAINSTSKK